MVDRNRGCRSGIDALLSIASYLIYLLAEVPPVDDFYKVLKIKFVFNNFH